MVERVKAEKISKRPGDKDTHYLQLEKETVIQGLAKLAKSLLK